MIAGPAPGRELGRLRASPPRTPPRSTSATEGDRAASPADRSGPAPVLIVTPTYNERENLEALVRELFEVEPEVDLLVVDDASPDGTAELCLDLAQRWPRLHLLRREGPRALGKAYVAGFHFGFERGYPVIGTMDADLSHSPRHLPAMLRQIHEGADVVLGSRYVQDGGTINWGLGRMLLSRARPASRPRY